MSIQKKSLSKTGKPATSTKPLKASSFTAESMKKKKRHAPISVTTLSARKAGGGGPDF